MIAAPKLARPTTPALKRHYLAVADAIDLPIVVRDFPPAVGGITMSVELIAALAAESAKAGAPQARGRAGADEE